MTGRLHIHNYNQQINEYKYENVCACLRMSLYICMYARNYACMHACMHVCMYVCTHTFVLI